MTRFGSRRLRPRTFLALVAMAVVILTPTGVAFAAGPVSSGGVGSASLAASVPPAAARPSHGPLFPISGPCDGPFPAFAGIGPYPAGCVGRDQAVVGFYSGLAGSGGNFTLALSLPSDRSPTANQSDLYRAIWVGLVLSDPSAWMSQCFLELRFQPDSSYAPNGSLIRSYNNWTAAAVGIAIDPQSSTEDSCFDQPLLRAGGGNGTYFTAAGGDALNLTASGWIGSSTGEQVTVVDASTGARGQVLGAMAGGTPLNPEYSASDVTDGAAFAAADVLPVSFGVDLAGAANPSIPSNSSFGGCTPGVPPPSHNDPSVPCPSYDPGSWVNDTAAPLRVGVPTFTNGSANSTAAEVAFSSTIGGTAGVQTLSNATCTGRLGSSFCTYPWFSYACGASALEFGATDFSGVTSDFGKDAQFPTVQSPGLVGHGQYAAGEFAVPLCGAPGYRVTVGSGPSGGPGNISFLGTNYATPTNLTLGAGEYSIEDFPASRIDFSEWLTGGNVSVLGPVDVVTTLIVRGSGTVSTNLYTGNPTTTVQFAGLGGSVSVSVGIGAPGGSAGLPVTVQNNSTVDLVPGLYPIQALPAPGRGWSGWRVQGNASVTGTASPATWLIVPPDGAVQLVWAVVSPASGPVALVVRASGNGTVTVNGSAVPYAANNDTSFANLTESAGSYPVAARPAPGWSFLGWRTAPGVVAIVAGLAPDINVTIVNGTGYLFATFGAQVTLNDSPVNAGSISLNGTGALGNGSAVLYARGTYSLAAVPAGGESFQHWQVSDPKALQVLRPGFPLTKLVVNSSATLTAVYAPQTTENVTFVLSSSSGGFVQFNFLNLTANTTLNTSVVNTTYELKAFASAAYRFNGFTTTGPVSVSSGELTVTGGGGVVTAHFALRLYPVTFVATRPGSATMSINGLAVASGSTLFLARGSYNLSASAVGADATFLEWSSLLAVSNVSANGANASLRVDAPGTVMGIVATFGLGRLAVSPSLADVDSPLQFRVFANGTGTLGYRYLGLPTGCASASTPLLLCLPDAAGTYSVRAAVSDAGGAVETSAPVNVTVVAAPVVASFSSTPLSTDVHVRVTFNVVPAEGTAPFSYSYSNLPLGCRTANVSNLSCTPLSAGTFPVGVAVTDAFGLVAYGNTTLTVTTDPKVVGATWSPGVVDTGIPTVLTTTTSGGTGALSYSYSGLPPDCPSVDSATVTCSSSFVRVSNVTVTITDALGLSAIAKNVLIVHERPHGAVLAFSPAALTLGGSTSVSAAVAAGTPPLSYAYLGLPTGCTSKNMTAFFCTPTQNGTFVIEFVATDAFGISTSTNATLTVSSPTPPPSPGPNTSATHGIDWRYVALIALVAVAVAAILVWRFGRPPTPPAAAPASTPVERGEDAANQESPGEPPR